MTRYIIRKATRANTPANTPAAHWPLVDKLEAPTLREAAAYVAAGAMYLLNAGAGHRAPWAVYADSTGDRIYVQRLER